MGLGSSSTVYGKLTEVPDFVRQTMFILMIVRGNIGSITKNIMKNVFHIHRFLPSPYF